jgi:hypothetical protein
VDGGVEYVRRQPVRPEAFRAAVMAPGAEWVTPEAMHEDHMALRRPIFGHVNKVQFGH